MDHIYETGVVSQTPPAYPADPVIGYPLTSATPGISTEPGAWWFYMITEELRNVELTAGLTPDPTKVNQISQALSKMGGNLTRMNSSWVAQRSDLVNVVSIGSSYALDFHKSSYFNLGTLTANATLVNPVNVEVGQTGIIIVAQDALGGRLLAFGSNFDFLDNIVPVLTGDPFAIDVLSYVVLPLGRIRLSVNGGMSASGVSVPPVDTLLTQYCQSTTLMGAYADGSGGAYDQVIEAYSLTCGGIARGVELSRFCSGTTLMGRYADGAGGSYDQVIEYNSLTCGYTPYVPGNRTWAAAGTYQFTVPAGVSTLAVTMLGGGGGGQYGNGNYAGQGGAGAGGLSGAKTVVNLAVTAGMELTLTVGVGGAGNNVGNGDFGTGPNGPQGSYGGITSIKNTATGVIMASAAGGIGGYKSAGNGVYGDANGLNQVPPGGSWNSGWPGEAGKLGAPGGYAGYAWANGGMGGAGAGGGGGAASNWDPNDYQTAGGNGGAGYLYLVW